MRIKAQFPRSPKSHFPRPTIFFTSPFQTIIEDTFGHSNPSTPKQRKTNILIHLQRRPLAKSATKAAARLIAVLPSSRERHINVASGLSVSPRQIIVIQSPEAYAKWPQCPRDNLREIPIAARCSSSSLSPDALADFIWKSSASRALLDSLWETFSLDAAPGVRYNEGLVVLWIFDDAFFSRSLWVLWTMLVVRTSILVVYVVRVEDEERWIGMD